MRQRLLRDNVRLIVSGHLSKRLVLLHLHDHETLLQTSPSSSVLVNNVLNQALRQIARGTRVGDEENMENVPMIVIVHLAESMSAPMLIMLRFGQNSFFDAPLLKGPSSRTVVYLLGAGGYPQLPALVTSLKCSKATGLLKCAELIHITPK